MVENVTNQNFYFHGEWAWGGDPVRNFHAGGHDLGKHRKEALAACLREEKTVGYTAEYCGAQFLPDITSRGNFDWLVLG